MEIKLSLTKYVIAVSGGVDSMVLLDLARNESDIEIIAAHFNHGIRDDSDKDEKLVSDYCTDNNILYITETGKLPSKSSEAESRNARYNFLQKVRKLNNFDAIMTAHHQDDLIETAIINILRGTGRRGFNSLKDSDTIKRPLLGYKKADIINYAKKNGIKWREDESNKDNKYLRNYVRNVLIPQAKKADANFEKDFLKHIQNTKQINLETDELLISVVGMIAKNKTINRSRFRQLPNEIKSEIVRYELGELDGVVNINSDHIAKLSKFIDQGLPKKVYDLSKDWQVELSRDSAEFLRK